jgi:hypothetical protein
MAYEIPPLQKNSQTPTILTTAHWEGDVWVEASGYRVARKWVDLYPHLFGPLKQDPDEGTGNVELDDTLTKAMSKIEGLGSVYSTWMERHCSETAFYISYNFVNSSDDIPPVPDFWIKEAHYWYMHITAGRLLRKEKNAESANVELVAQLATCIPWKKVAAAILAAAAAGGFILPDVAKAIITSIGA